MKIKFTLAAAGLALGASLRAATLSATTAVQSQPDPASPVITVLSAGSEEPAHSDKAGVVPDGWSAVEVPGPFEAYVRNKDLTKQLDVTPGAPVYLGPKEDSGVLTTFEKGDKAEITGLHGAWTQVHLEKTLVGFIRTAPSVAAAAPVAPVAAPVPVVPAAPSAAAAAMPEAPAPSTGGPALSRLFEGTLTGTRSLLSPHQPYPLQLVDSSGSRIAYVDVSKLLMTDQIDDFRGHSVVVLGSFQSVAGTQDIVIEAEALRLK
jgi:hypothetical protein